MECGMPASEDLKGRGVGVMFKRLGLPLLAGVGDAPGAGLMWLGVENSRTGTGVANSDGTPPATLAEAPRDADAACLGELGMSR